MNFGEPASALSEHSVTGFVGFAKLSISVCRLSCVLSMTNGSDAGAGVARQDSSWIAGLEEADGEASGLGDVDGLGEGDGDGVVMAGDSLTTAGGGVNAPWRGAPGPAHAQAIEARPIVMPSLTRATQHQRRARVPRYRVSTSPPGPSTCPGVPAVPRFRPGRAGRICQRTATRTRLRSSPGG